MNLAVAIHTSTTHDVFAWKLSHTGGIGSAQASLKARSVHAHWRATGMRAVMAFLAEEGGTRFKEGRNVGAVRRVAIGTIFCHRLVLKQKGTAFFRMTLITSFSHCVFLQQLGACRTMGVMAI
jgi:hypothetical protein